jgi:hypothetical protein
MERCLREAIRRPVVIVPPQQIPFFFIAVLALKLGVTLAKHALYHLGHNPSPAYTFFVLFVGHLITSDVDKGS